MIKFHRPDPVRLILVEGDVDGKCIDNSFLDRFPHTAEVVKELGKENIIQEGDIVPVLETSKLTVMYAAVDVWSRSYGKYLSEPHNYNKAIEKAAKHMALHGLHEMLVENPSLSLLRSLVVFENTQTLHCHQVRS